MQLFNLGAEQAIHVYDGNGNHRLDAGDSLTFYAAAVPAGYRKYSRYNVYWLIDAGSASPMRMGSVDGAPAAGALAASHRFTAHHELDQLYLQSAAGPDASRQPGYRLRRCAECYVLKNDLIKYLRVSQTFHGIEDLNAGQKPFSVIIGGDAFRQVLCSNSRLLEANVKSIDFAIISDAS